MKPEGINSHHKNAHCAIVQCAALPRVLVVPCQQRRKPISLAALSSDESVMLWELSLDIYTLCVEKKLLLFCLSSQRSLGSEEGTSDQQTMPELSNEAFSAKAT